MNDLGFELATTLLNLFHNEGQSRQLVEALVDNKALRDLLEAHPRQIDRLAFRETLGLETPFCYGGPLLETSIPSKSLPDLLKEFGISASQYNSRQIDLPGYRGNPARLRPIYFKDAFSSQHLLPTVKEYGWEGADAIDTVMYAVANSTGLITKRGVIIAPCTENAKNDPDRYFFAIGYPVWEALWYPVDAISHAFGPGVQYLLRKRI